MKKLFCIVGLFFILFAAAAEEVIPLKLDKKSYDALFQPAKTPSKGGIIILPGANGARNHPLLKTLAEYLSKNHWDTLLLSWPEIDLSADHKTLNKTQDDFLALTQSAIDQLTKKSGKKIIIISFGSSSTLLLNQMKKKPLSINAMVFLSMQPPFILDEKKPIPANEKILPQLKIPLLDIVAEQDYSATLKYFNQRQMQLEKNHPYYQSKIMESTDHDYSHQEKKVAEKIKEWLKKNFL